MTKFWGKLFLINFAIGVVTGHHARVPVRHQLVALLGLRRRHLRVAAGDRGDGGVLPGVHLHRRLVLRVEQALEAGSTWRRSGWWPSPPTCSAFWILVGQRLDAAPGRVRDPQRARRADRLLRGRHAAVRHPRVRAHARRRVHPGRRSSCWASRPGTWRGADVAIFRSRSASAPCGRWSSPFEIAQGHMNAEILGSTQPTKLAAMESHWETGTSVPLYLVAWPDGQNERNASRRCRCPRCCRCWPLLVPRRGEGLKDCPRRIGRRCCRRSCRSGPWWASACCSCALGLWVFWARRRLAGPADALLGHPAAVPGQRAADGRWPRSAGSRGSSTA